MCEGATGEIWVKSGRVGKDAGWLPGGGGGGGRTASLKVGTHCQRTAPALTQLLYVTQFALCRVSDSAFQSELFIKI